MFDALMSLQLLPPGAFSWLQVVNRSVIAYGIPIKNEADYESYLNPRPVIPE